MHIRSLRRLPEWAPPALLFAVLSIVLLAPQAGMMAHRRPLLLEILALGLCAGALVRAQVGSLATRAGTAFRAGPNLPLLLLAAYALFSARHAPYKGLANSEWLRVAGGVTLYFVVAYAAQLHHRYRAVVDGLIAIALLGTVTELARSASGESPMSAVFGNRQLLASILLLLLPLLLVVSLAARNAVRKLAAQVAFIVVAAGLMLAQTRSAWAGAVVSLVVLALIYASRSDGLRQLSRAKHRAALVLVPVLGAAGLFVAVSLASPLLVARMGTLGHLAGDTNLQWRLHQWAGTWKMIAAHPWLGWGLGSYAVAINQFVLDSTPREIVLRYGPNLTQNAHSLYLQMLAELGIVGTALYLWVLGAFFVTGFRALRSRSATSGRLAVLAACLAAVAGQMVDAGTNPAYQFGEVSLLFWLIVGLGMAAAQIAPCPELSLAAEPASASRRCGITRRLAWQGAMLSAVGIVLASGFALGQDFLPAEPVYTQITRFDLTGRSASTGVLPGYTGPVVMSGECVELQLAIQFASSKVYQAERSPFIQLTTGGSAPASCVVQQPPPNQNVFCIPTTAGPECNGKQVSFTATYPFRGQVFTKTVTFDILGASCAIAATVDRPVLPATGNLETVNVTFANPPAGQPAPLLQRVEIYPGPTTTSPTGDVIYNYAGQFQLKAVAGRTYVLLYKTRDSFNRPCYIRLAVLVSSESAFEIPAAPAKA